MFTLKDFTAGARKWGSSLDAAKEVFGSLCTDVKVAHLFSNGQKERTLVGYIRAGAAASFDAFVEAHPEWAAVEREESTPQDRTEFKRLRAERKRANRERRARNIKIAATVSAQKDAKRQRKLARRAIARGEATAE